VPGPRRARRRGRGPELDIVDLLRADGWIAYRIAHGVADVVALRPHEVPRLVQVKSTAQSPYERFGPVDRGALLMEARRAGACAMLAWWPPTAPVPKWIASDAWPVAQMPLFTTDRTP
jgi:Holliday junction resolvase